MTRHERLLAELHRYDASDPAEERHRAAMIALLHAPDAFSRAHFQPGHFTASCYVIDDGGRLLLHHHRRLDRWLQMGGHVEGDESPERTALREGEEESGLRDLVLWSAEAEPPLSYSRESESGGLASALQTIFDLDVHAIPAAKGEPDHDHFDVRYLARTASPERIALDRAESNDLAWVTLERAAELMPGSESHRVLRKIERMLHERSLS